MNYTINYTTENGACTETPSIDITSDLITDYIAALPNPDHTLELKIAVNCDTTYTIDIDDDNDNLDVAGDKYVITPSDVNQTDSLSDSVYHVTLTKTITATNGQTIEYSCIFVDCKLKCRLFDYVAVNLDSDITKYYDRLADLGTCDDCACEAACLFYQKLIDAITDTGTCKECG